VEKISKTIGSACVCPKSVRKFFQDVKVRFSEVCFLVAWSFSRLA